MTVLQYKSKYKSAETVGNIKGGVTDNSTMRMYRMFFNPISLTSELPCVKRLLFALSLFHSPRWSAFIVGCLSSVQP